MFLGHPALQGLPALLEVPGAGRPRPDADEVRKAKELARALAAVSRYRWVVLGAGTLAQTSISAVLIGLAAISPALRDATTAQPRPARHRARRGRRRDDADAAPLGHARRPHRRARRDRGRARGAAAALAAAATSGELGGLVALLAVAGLFGASVNAASGRAVMGWFPHDERGLALGIRQTAIPIGGAPQRSCCRLARRAWSLARRVPRARRGCARRRPRAGAIWRPRGAARPGARSGATALARPRPRDVAALRRQPAPPRRADRDAELRRALPPRAPRALAPRRGRRARG